MADRNPPEQTPQKREQRERSASVEVPAPERELGGRKGPDPTRYGDWEKDGRCIDF